MDGASCMLELRGLFGPDFAWVGVYRCISPGFVSRWGHVGGVGVGVGAGAGVAPRYNIT